MDLALERFMEAEIWLAAERQRLRAGTADAGTPLAALTHSRASRTAHDKRLDAYHLLEAVLDALHRSLSEAPGAGFDIPPAPALRFGFDGAAGQWSDNLDACLSDIARRTADCPLDRQGEIALLALGLVALDLRSEEASQSGPPTLAPGPANIGPSPLA